MRKRELAKLIGMLGGLTRDQRQVVAAELSAAENRVAAVDIVEGLLPGRPRCPHCSGDCTVRNGHANGLQRHKCRSCGKTFNALTGTPLAGLHLRGKWLAQAAAMRDGLSLNRTADRLGIAQSTAFRWRHRFLATPRTIQAQALVGIAEADEAYFLKSAKGQRGLLRKPRKRGGKASTRGTSKDHHPVLFARDRTGSTANFVLNATTAQEIGSVLKPILPVDTVLCTDGSSALARVARDLGVEHHPVKVSSGIRVKGAWHVQNINAFASRLRQWMVRFKGVSSRYLENYLGWFRTLDRSPGFSPEPASLLAIAAGHEGVISIREKSQRKPT
jgi:transposase-like protein